MSQQGDRQATVRAATGTAGAYEGDWHALFDIGAVTPGAFDGRLLSWINGQLGANYPEINGAMHAFAVANGAKNWSEMGAFTIAGGGGHGPSLQMEDGSFLLMEDGSRILLE